MVLRATKATFLVQNFKILSLDLGGARTELYTPHCHRSDESPFTSEAAAITISSGESNSAPAHPEFSDKSPSGLSVDTDQFCYKQNWLHRLPAVERAPVFHLRYVTGTINN